MSVIVHAPEYTRSALRPSVTIPTYGIEAGSPSLYFSRMLGMLGSILRLVGGALYR